MIYSPSCRRNAVNCKIWKDPDLCQKVKTPVFQQSDLLLQHAYIWVTSPGLFKTQTGDREKKKVEFLIQFVICNVFGGNCKMLAFSAESSQMYSLNKA